MVSDYAGGIGSVPIEQPVRRVSVPQRSGSTAALLEVLFGFFFNTFGLGHIYAGDVGKGLLIMFAFWGLQVVNVLLCFVLIGFITLPVTWIVFMVWSTMAASKRVEELEAARMRA